MGVKENPSLRSIPWRYQAACLTEELSPFIMGTHIYTQIFVARIRDAAMKIFLELSSLARKWRAIQQESAVRRAYAEGRFSDAVIHARTLYESELNNPWANFFLACHHIEAERYTDALEHLMRVLTNWPDDAYTHFAIGLCHDYLEALRPAADSYSRTLELEPDWAKARKNLGRDLYLLGDYPAAEDALRLCCATSPEDREAHDLLGYVCYRQGKFQDSFGHYEYARRLDPFNPKLARNARLLYMKTARS